MDGGSEPFTARKRIRPVAPFSVARACQGGGASLVYLAPMSDPMLRILGWRALLIHGDPCVLDRWLWLRGHLRRGNARTFDAGAGNGGFSIYAARAGNDVVAASFSERELESVRR